MCNCLGESEVTGSTVEDHREVEKCKKIVGKEVKNYWLFRLTSGNMLREPLKHIAGLKTPRRPLETLYVLS